jgi:hypothetical protein
VLIGFISKRKGFQKLLENAFKILEKEKKIEILSFLNFWPEGLLPLLLISACSASSPARSRNGPAQQFTGRSRAPFSSHRVTATPGPHVSGIVFFLSLVTEPVTPRWSPMPTRR